MTFSATSGGTVRWFARSAIAGLFVSGSSWKTMQHGGMKIALYPRSVYSFLMAFDGSSVSSAALHVVENAFRCAFEFNAARYCAC